MSLLPGSSQDFWKHRHSLFSFPGSPGVSAGTVCALGSAGFSPNSFISRGVHIFRVLSPVLLLSLCSWEAGTSRGSALLGDCPSRPPKYSMSGQKRQKRGSGASELFRMKEASGPGCLPCALEGPGAARTCHSAVPGAGCHPAVSLLSPLQCLALTVPCPSLCLHSNPSSCCCIPELRGTE